MTKTNPKYSPEVRERSVRMVWERQNERLLSARPSS